MRRFFPREIKGDTAYIDGTEAAHLSRVLRMKAGDKVLLLNDGLEHEAELLGVEKELATARILQSRPCAGEPKVHITLFAAYMKADKMELIAQKATELGVSELVTFFSERCVKHPEGKSLDKSVERMRRITWEAAKQCGRSKPIEISGPSAFEEMLQRVKASDAALFAYEKANDPLKEALGSFLQAKDICLIVGSEGGFTQEEAIRIQQVGARSVSLGTRILRGETAAIALSAVTAYEMGC